MPDLKWRYCPEEIEMMQQINGKIMGTGKSRDYKIPSLQMDDDGTEFEDRVSQSFSFNQICNWFLLINIFRYSSLIHSENQHQFNELA